MGMGDIIQVAWRRTLNKTKIEWVRNPDGTQGYSWNPIKGWCPNNCPYCYAHRMYDRFGWNREIRFDLKEFHAVEKLKDKESARVFVGSTIEMYHSERRPAGE